MTFRSSVTGLGLSDKVLSNTTSETLLRLRLTIRLSTEPTIDSKWVG